MGTASVSSRAAFRRLVERAEKDPFFLGRAIAVYREVHGLVDSELSRWLGCPSTKALDRLRLCRLPDDPPEVFAREVRRIAEFVPCNADRLVWLLREAAALEAIRSGGASADRTLLAARDKRPQDEDSKPDEKDEGPTEKDG